MDDIKINEELTKMGMMADCMATIKKTMDPEAYESIWQDALSMTKDLYKGHEKEASLDAIISEICEKLIKDPYSLIEIMESLQEDKES